MKIIKEIEVICDICKKSLTISYLKYTIPGYNQDLEIEERLKEAGWKICYTQNGAIDCCEKCSKENNEDI